MRARFMKTVAVSRLRRDVKKNLKKYRSGNFEELDSPEYFFEAEISTVEEADLATLEHPGAEKRDIAKFDPINAETVYNAIQITPYIGKDERFWAYLTHVTCLDYSRSRWPIPEDDGEAVKRIHSHFFAQGERGFKRNNAMARLWWDAHLVHKYEDQAISKSLEVLLYRTDVRAQISDRATSANSTAVFSALMRLLTKRYDAKDEQFFARKGHDGPHRKLMKEINARGGQKLLDCMSPSQLDGELEDILSNI